MIIPPLAVVATNGGSGCGDIHDVRGVVQANVGQKLLKHNTFKSFYGVKTQDPEATFCLNNAQ